MNYSMSHSADGQGEPLKRVLLATVYVLLLCMLGLALWYPGTAVSTFVIVVVALLIAAEAVYILYFRRNQSLCGLCAQWLCE